MADGRGTDHDESEAAELAAVAAPGQEQTNHASDGSAKDGSQRAVGPETITANEAGEGSGGGAGPVRASVETIASLTAACCMLAPCLLGPGFSQDRPQSV